MDQDDELEDYALIADAVWDVTIRKIIDILDRVFSILSKKQAHILFLHVQNHVSNVIVLWIGGRYFADHLNEISTMFLFSTVTHMAMYVYYLIGSTNMKYSRWRIILMVQFMVIVFYLIASIRVNCGYHQQMVGMLTIDIVANLVLFFIF